MAKPKKIKANQLINRDQNIIKTNSYLELQKSHKKWFLENAMGKQRGKPTAIPKESKKASGTKKHSLRQEIKRHQ